MYSTIRQNRSFFCTDHDRDQNDIQRCVLQILGSHGIGHPRVERRADERFPFPYVLYVTPATSPDPVEPPIVIVGKHISRHGLDFYHRDPLPHRHMIVTVEDPRGNRIQLLLDITWCRFIRQSWYASGGKFLGVADSPAPDRPKTEAKTQDIADGRLVLTNLTASAW